MCGVRVGTWRRYSTPVVARVPYRLSESEPGVPSNENDPFWCPWNPATGAQYPRTMAYILQCDPTVKGAVEVSATQNKTNDCR